MKGTIMAVDAPDGISLKPLTDPSSGSLVDAVYQHLLEAIVSGDIPSGSVLSEVLVAKQLNVSRTPVHDALRQLAKDGLVDRANGRRARVAGFSRDDIFEIFEMRKYLEAPAAELAAGRMDRRQIGPLREMAAQLAGDPEAPDWATRWAEFDEQFHNAIAQGSGNKRLARDIRRYRLLYRGLSQLSAGGDALVQALRQYNDILDALAAHDGTAARAAMERHIAHWQDFFIHRSKTSGSS